MPLPVHNTTATAANLARSVLTTIDRSRIETPVATATLVLLLETLVEMAEPQREKVAENQARTVRQMAAQIETAARERDEDRHQAQGGEKPRRAWG